MRDGCGSVATRRAGNMLLFAADLRATGLRPDLDDRAVADVVWATNSPQYFALLRARGWSPAAYAEHLADLWRQTCWTPGRVGAPWFAADSRTS